MVTRSFELSPITVGEKIDIFLIARSVSTELECHGAFDVVAIKDNAHTWDDYYPPPA
jgi:hypothetical protein